MFSETWVFNIFITLNSLRFILATLQRQTSMGHGSWPSKSLCRQISWLTKCGLNWVCKNVYLDHSPNVHNLSIGEKVETYGQLDILLCICSCQQSVWIRHWASTGTLSPCIQHIIITVWILQLHVTAITPAKWPLNDNIVSHTCFLEICVFGVIKHHFKGHPGHIIFVMRIS